MVDFLNLKETTISDLANKVNLVGIINSRIICKTYKTGSILERMGVILPCESQIILEIWSRKDTRPIYATDWTKLQMITILSACFGGETKVSGQYIKVFRVEMKNAKNNRFIWLSDENPTFWVNPILQRNSDADFFQECDLNWPRQVPVAKGLLRKSKGSYVAKKVFKFMGHLHTDHFSDQIHFASILKLYQKVRKSVHGVLNFYTGKPACDKFSFDRLFKYFPYSV